MPLPHYENLAAAGAPSARWRRYCTPGGSLVCGADGLRLVLAGASRHAYSDAQVDDCCTVAGAPLLWHPPLRLTLRARFSHAAGHLRGTAGFGFWNYPLFAPGMPRPTLPGAIWFFYASPPSDMRLDTATPGAGWKAATIDTRSAAALALLPLAPLVVPLLAARRALFPHVWRPIQRALRICEAPIAASMTDWHIYTLEWGRRHARFLVDGCAVLTDAPAPRGPFTLVIWIDNQYLIVTPWGHLGWGLLDVAEPQWLEVAWLALEPLTPAVWRAA